MGAPRSHGPRHGPSEKMPGKEIDIPFMGGNLTFQDPFDFQTDEGQTRHVNARVVVTGKQSTQKLEVPALLALITAVKISEVKEWLERNKP